MLIGKYTNSIDAKGRVIFPAKLRDDIGEEFIIAKSLFDSCLCAYSKTEWERLSDAVKGLPRSKARTVESWLFGSACEMIPDKQGRILISSELIKHAGLCKEVVFVGMSSRVELWDSEKYNEMYSNITPESVAEILEDLGF